MKNYRLLCSYESSKTLGSGRSSQQIEVFDRDTNETKTYDSISAAAKSLNINKSRICHYFKNNQKKPYGEAGRYIFNKI
jgi:hypothetical protein